MAKDVTPPIPAGFTEVSREKFFVLLSKGEAGDLMPQTTPDHTTWEAWRDGRFVWGWTSPGWRNSGAPRQYAVRDEVAQEGKAS